MNTLWYVTWRWQNKSENTFSLNSVQYVFQRNGLTFLWRGEGKYRTYRHTILIQRKLCTIKRMTHKTTWTSIYPKQGKECELLVPVYHWQIHTFCLLQQDFQGTPNTKGRSVLHLQSLIWMTHLQRWLAAKLNIHALFQVY